MMAAAALDRARGQVLGVVGRWPPAQTLARRRSLRLAVVALASIAAAFAGTALVPLLLLGVAPLVLGVPHLAADLRYLVFKRAVISRRARVPLSVAAIGCSLAAASGRVDVMLAIAWAGVALAALLSAGFRRRRLAVAAVAAVIAAMGWQSPSLAAMTMAQGHNFIAVALALWLTRRTFPLWWLAALIIVAGVATILAGALDGILTAALAGGSARLFATAIAPAAASSTMTARLFGVFTFMQAVHYAVWLRLVPDAAREGERPIGYRQSLRLLWVDFGWLAAPILALAAAVPLAAFVSAGGARQAYFVLAAFHGYVELAFIGAAFIAPSAPASARAVF
jgi:hypothetical protein